MRFHSFIKASFIVDTLQCCSKVGLIGEGGGESNHARRRRELLGGSGGMLPRKILKYDVSEIDILNQFCKQNTAMLIILREN